MGFEKERHASCRRIGWQGIASLEKTEGGIKLRLKSWKKGTGRGNGKEGKSFGCQGGRSAGWFCKTAGKERILGGGKGGVVIGGGETARGGIESNKGKYKKGEAQLATKSYCCQHHLTSRRRKGKNHKAAKRRGA